MAEEDCFALKGGTAINLFYRDLPRLSVDIDLTYLPLAERTESLGEIEAALTRIKQRIKKVHPRNTITGSAPKTQAEINKLVVRTPAQVQIKIEVTPVFRGCVYDPEFMTVSDRTEDQFGFAEINVLSFADLFAGKILAALDRQHPRDLFDVRQLLDKEGITDKLRTAFVLYLISHDHPPQNLLSASCRDITHDYEKSFVGMAEVDPAMDELVGAHEQLSTAMRDGMSDEHKEFLLGFYRRDPDWSLLDVEGVAELPAIRWREINLDKAGEETREQIARELGRILS